MVNSRQLQLLYNDLYVQFRKYIWPLSTIELLADFEVECYKAFPTMSNVLRIFNKLNLDVRSTYVDNDDDDFKDAIDNIKQFIVDNQHDKSTNIYYKLNRVQEVI